MRARTLGIALLLLVAALAVYAQGYLALNVLLHFVNSILPYLLLARATSVMRENYFVHDRLAEQYKSQLRLDEGEAQYNEATIIYFGASTSNSKQWRPAGWFQSGASSSSRAPLKVAHNSNEEAPVIWYS